MTKEEFKQRADAKSQSLADGNATSQEIESHLCDTLKTAQSLFGRPAPTSPAIDPAFWLTLISTLVPILLEWINRRFPRPSPAGSTSDPTAIPNP